MHTYERKTESSNTKEKKGKKNTDMEILTKNRQKINSTSSNEKNRTAINVMHLHRIIPFENTGKRASRVFAAPVIEVSNFFHSNTLSLIETPNIVVPPEKN
jgi:hypothetical protein